MTREKPRGTQDKYFYEQSDISASTPKPSFEAILLTQDDHWKCNICQNDEKFDPLSLVYRIGKSKQGAKIENDKIKQGNTEQFDEQLGNSTTYFASKRGLIDHMSLMHGEKW